MEEEDSMKRKKIYGIFMLVAIAVFLFAGGRILQIYLNYQESQKVYEQMEGFTQKIEDQNLSPEAVPGETPEEVAEQGFLQVDFNKLEEINPDVIAWIEIPGLEISYPVVQGRDNDYYLHHLITGENHKSGSIFMDFHNQEDLSDRNSIIYGHNMKDGSMFGTLDQYIHATMIYPFVRMLQEKCRDLTEEQIHKTLWKEYEISGADRMFVERASKILEPYEGESEDEK